MARGYSAVVLSDSPDLYLRLGEASGTTAADSSGDGHVGTYGGGATLGADGLVCDNDKAVYLGASGIVSVPSSAVFDYTTAFSAEAWVRSTDSNDGGYVVSRLETGDPVWRLSVDSFQLAGCAVEHAGVASPLVTSSGAFPATQPAHLVMTFDGTTLRLYVNGLLAGSRAVPGAMDLPVGDGRIRVGKPDGASYASFPNVVDEVAVYGHVLTPERVWAHYIAAKCSTVAPPCRRFPRADDLGVGGGRAYPPPRSQQRSGRRFGFY